MSIVRNALSFLALSTGPVQVAAVRVPTIRHWVVGWAASLAVEE